MKEGPIQAQLTTSKEVSVFEVLKVFGVPCTLAGHFPGANGRSILGEPWAGGAPRPGAWSARRCAARVRAWRLVEEAVPVGPRAVLSVWVGAGRRLRVTTAALPRPEPSAFFAAPPAPQAPGKCAALRRGPRPPERRAAGEGGRPWSQRAPLRVSPPSAPRSPLSSLCSTLPDPRSQTPNSRSILPDPGSSPSSLPVVRRRRVPITSLAAPL